MFGIFRKRRGDGPANQRAPLPPLSAEIKAQRDREFAERLQQRLDTQMGTPGGDKIEPKFKNQPQVEPKPPRTEPPPRAASDNRREERNPAPAAPRTEVKAANGTKHPQPAAPPPVAPPPAVPERDAKRPQPILSLPLVMRAAQFAADRHKAQRRKGGAREPYVNHLLEVAVLLAEAGEGKDPELVIAGLLHDVVEEQGVSADEMAAQFGNAVAALVLEVTDDKSLPPPERRRLQIVNAPNKSPRARMLKLADLVSNLRALRQSPPADWPAERQRDYVQWARDVAGGCRGVNPCLDAAFDEAQAAFAIDSAPDTELRAASDL